MKRLFAITLSLLLMWMQVVVMALPAKADVPAKRSGCSCKRNCCIAQSDSSRSMPQPAAPVRSIQLNLQPFTLTASPAWLLPRTEADVFPSPVSSPLLIAAVPLFHRDCALLI